MTFSFSGRYHINFCYIKIQVKPLKFRVGNCKQRAVIACVLYCERDAINKVRSKL